MSPLCKLSQKKGPLKWFKDVNDTYKKDSDEPEYIKGLESQMRETYPSEKLKSGELLKIRTEKVNDKKLT